MRRCALQVRAYDTVIIGAGPAGLSAAAELGPHGRCLVLDQGPPARARDRSAPRDLLSGVGGAGLFSDGKHSFFPSASALWTLPDARALAQSFDATAALLARFGVDAGPLALGPAPDVAPGVWQAKHYRSIHASLADRYRMIEELWSAGADRNTGARVVDAGRAGAEIVLAIERGSEREEVRAASVVVATGRWSPRWIRPWLEKLGVSFAFRRVEAGVRLEMRASHPLFAKLPGVDGKLRLVENDSEIRTFCTCRDGEVILGEASGLRAFSGRADGLSTGRSNVGLLVRTADESLGRAMTRALDTAIPASFDLAAWRAIGPARLAPIFGARGADLLTVALGRFDAFCPELAGESVRVHAPVIEGVGDYPIDDGALGVAPGVYLAGDAGGRFRGIVAAMVSARYVARRIMATTR